jgi:hypothetical protein
LTSFAFIPEFFAEQAGWIVLNSAYPLLHGLLFFLVLSGLFDGLLRHCLLLCIEFVVHLARLTLLLLPLVFALVLLLRLILLLSLLVLLVLLGI